LHPIHHFSSWKLQNSRTFAYTILKQHNEAGHGGRQVVVLPSRTANSGNGNEVESKVFGITAASVRAAEQAAADPDSWLLTSEGAVDVAELFVHYHTELEAVTGRSAIALLRANHVEESPPATAAAATTPMLSSPPKRGRPTGVFVNPAHGL
jgi:hypothetical protein